MPTNDFIGFASSGSANIASQADYAAAAEQGIGMQPGPASSKLANKAWRQGANMAAALGRIAAARGYDALDNGDLNTLQSAIDDTISVGTFNRMYFSQTSGNFVAPRTGVYRITLKGGGGGGGGKSSSTTGGGGGEGGESIFYTTLVKSASYAYIIGAGGTAGASDVSGTNGGNSSIEIQGTTYTAHGADGGSRGGIGGQGGGGGVTSGGTGTFYGRRGEAGSSGAAISSRPRGPRGGGLSGGSDGNVSRNGLMGCGGHGDGTNSATAGGDGYILIEYAG